MVVRRPGSQASLAPSASCFTPLGLSIPILKIRMILSPSPRLVSGITAALRWGQAGKASDLLIKGKKFKVRHKGREVVHSQGSMAEGTRELNPRLGPTCHLALDCVHRRKGHLFHIVIWSTAGVLSLRAVDRYLLSD